LDVRVLVDEQHIIVELLTRNIFGRLSTWWWPELVWFEGTLTASDNDLTRIKGAIKQHISLSYFVLALQLVLLVTFASALLVTFYDMGRPAKTLIAWVLFWATFIVGVIIPFVINKRHARRLTPVLQSWLSHRLNI
jgi:hypothetical protein